MYHWNAIVPLQVEELQPGESMASRLMTTALNDPVDVYWFDTYGDEELKYTWQANYCQEHGQVTFFIEDLTTGCAWKFVFEGNVFESICWYLKRELDPFGLLSTWQGLYERRIAA